MQRLLTIIIATLFSFCLGGCIIKPYQTPIQQGNILSEKQINQVHEGMTSNQITQKLGQPVLTNLYNNYLTYVYTYLATKHSSTEKMKLVITLKNNKAIKIEHSQTKNHA